MYKEDHRYLANIGKYTHPQIDAFVDAGGGGTAPIDATYVCLSTHSILTNERVLTAGTGIQIIDGGAGSTVTLNCTITQYTDALAKVACVSDAAYGAGWNGVTDVAPSKNAVYDKIESLGSGLWTDVTTYIKPDNVTDSGNTAIRIYDTGYQQLGIVPAYTDSGGVSGGLQLQIDASASSIAKPNLWIERDITANYISGTLYVPAGLAVNVNKTLGNAFVHGMYSECLLTGGTNDMVAVGGWTIASLASRNVFGGWFRASVGSYASLACGVETNIGSDIDRGHQTYCGYLTQVGFITAAVNNNATFGFYLAQAGGDKYKFHTGICIACDSVVPTDPTSYINEAIHIQGGSTVANDYNAIILDQYIQSGLYMVSATVADYAIALGNQMKISWYTGAVWTYLYQSGTDIYWWNGTTSTKLN